MIIGELLLGKNKLEYCGMIFDIFGIIFGCHYSQEESDG
jgi:hypothetical protein